MFELDEFSLVRLLRSQPDPKSPLDCLEDETIGAYLDGGLNESERDEFDKHLAGCGFCLDHFLAAHAAMLDISESPVPLATTARALALMPPPRSFGDVFSIVVEFARDSLVLIATSGRVVIPASAAQIRGKENSTDIAMLQIERALGRLQIGVEIERLEGDLCQVVVTVKSADGGLAEGLRFSLLSGERERASYLARQGAATFERIPPGEYQLAVTESGNSLGTIELTIKEDRRER